MPGCVHVHGLSGGGAPVHGGVVGVLGVRRGGAEEDRRAVAHAQGRREDGGGERHEVEVMEEVRAVHLPPTRARAHTHTQP